MVRPIAIFLLVLGLIAPLHGQQAPAQAFTRLEPTAKELDASLRTDWYGVYLQDKKIGYFKAARERTDDGIRESILLHMKLLSFGQKADMTIARLYADLVDDRELADRVFSRIEIMLPSL